MKSLYNGSSNILSWVISMVGAFWAKMIGQNLSTSQITSFPYFLQNQNNLHDDLRKL